MRERYNFIVRRHAFISRLSSPRNDCAECGFAIFPAIIGLSLSDMGLRFIIGSGDGTYASS